MDHAAAARARVEPASPVAPPARLTEGIVLTGVAFAYPGTEKRVFDQVDLVLPAGSTVAIVGDKLFELQRRAYR